MSLSDDFSIDAYTASVPSDEPTDLVSDLVEVFDSCGFSGVSLEAFNPRHFDSGVQIKDDHGQLCTVQYGGRNPHPSVASQGAHSATLANYLRSAHPDHTCSRIDSCIDLVAPALFDTSFDLLVAVAREHRITKSQYGDFMDKQGGRTFYLGAKKSARLVRLYEKGKQLADQGYPDADTDHVRCEVQYRPEHASQKAAAASMAPADVWGTSPWLIDTLRAFSGIEAAPVSLRRYRPKDDLRTRHWLLTQYGKHLATWAEECGGYEHLGINIEYALRAHNEHQSAVRSQRRKAA